MAHDDYGRTADLIAREVGSVELLITLQGTRNFVHACLVKIEDDCPSNRDRGV